MTSFGLDELAWEPVDDVIISGDFDLYNEYNTVPPLPTLAM